MRVRRPDTPDGEAQTLEELIAELPGAVLVDNYEDSEIGIRGVLDGGVQFLLNGIPLHPDRIKGPTQTERSRMNLPVEAPRGEQEEPSASVFDADQAAGVESQLRSA